MCVSVCTRVYLLCVFVLMQQWDGEKGGGGGGCVREGKLDSHQLIEMYQPAGQQPQNFGALADLWLRENTTARG